MRLALALLLTLLASGCDMLFPEFAGKAPDLSVTDGSAAAGDGGAAQVVGRVCALGDVRAPSTCAPVAGPFRVSIEETRAQGMTDVTGAFVLALDPPVAQLTLAVSDPRGVYSTTVTRVPTAATVAVPLFDAAREEQAAIASGVPFDPRVGRALVWVLGPDGRAVQGAVAAREPARYGPLYDGAAAGEISLGSGATGPFGLVAWYDLPAGDTKVAVSPPAASGYKADTFVLPIRPGAITLSALSVR